jgi:hypothetical protein
LEIALAACDFLQEDCMEVTDRKLEEKDNGEDSEVQEE